MMGFWSLSNGSSSSLSALAQPFTVDRLGPKLNSNPPVNFKELPYDAHFNPTRQNSDHFQQISNHDFNFASNPELGVEPFYANQMTNPNPITTDAFQYGQYSDGLITSVVPTKPYYPTYTEGMKGIDNIHPFYPNCEALSSLSVNPHSKSHHDDYTRRLNCLDYSSMWGGGFSNGLIDRKNNKLGLDDPTCSNYVNQGAKTVEGLITREEPLLALDSKLISNWETGIYIDKLAGRNPKCIESSKTSVLGPSLNTPETSFEQSSLEPISNVFNHKNPSQRSAVVIRPPSLGTKSSTSDFSSKNVKAVGNGKMNINEIFQEDSCRVSTVRGDPVNVKSHELEDQNISNCVPKEISESHVSQISGSRNIHLEVSVKKSCESLDDDTALDSPCWKGASTSRFSAFKVHEDPIKKSEACNDCTIDNSAKTPQKFGEDTTNHVNQSLEDTANDGKIKVNDMPNLKLDSAQFNSTGDDLAKLSDSGERKLIPKINVEMLVATMHNLSEILLFHCSEDLRTLKDREHEYIVHVINNLEACMLNVGRIPPNKESIIPSKVESTFLDGLADIGKGLTSCCPLLMKGTEIRENNGITVTTKSIKCDNFYGQNEMLPPRYEAKAEQYSLHKAPFDELKIDTRKSQFLKVEDGEKSLSSNIFCLAKSSATLVSEDDKDTPISHVDKVSVMDGFRFVKSGDIRTGQSNIHQHRPSPNENEHNGIGKCLSGGWYYDSSSDWEDVLKDIAWKN